MTRNSSKTTWLGRFGNIFSLRGNQANKRTQKRPHARRLYGVEPLEARSLMAVDLASDLTETSLVHWSAFATGTLAGSSTPATAQVFSEVSVKKEATRAIGLNTNSGFDTGVQFRPGESLNVSSFSAVELWVRGENPNVNGFQGNQPVLEFISSNGTMRLTPQVQLMPNGSWAKLVVPLAGSGSWLRTTTGSFDPLRVTALKVHQDTWDYGFKAYYDGLRFTKNAGAAPVLTAATTQTTFVEGNTQGVSIAPDATIRDSDSPTFRNGRIFVQITKNQDRNADTSTDDRLLIASQGISGGQVGAVSGVLYYSGKPIGTYSGGANDPLQIQFTSASVTAAVAQQVLRSIHFQTLGVAPSTATREITTAVQDDRGLWSQLLRTNVAVQQLQTTLVAPQVTTTSPLVVGGSFDVDLQVSNVSNLYGFGLVLRFDPTKLQVEDADPGTSGVQISPGTFLGADYFMVVNKVDNTTGRIELAVTKLGAIPGTTGSGSLGKVRFKAMQIGLTTIRTEQAQLVDNTPQNPNQLVTRISDLSIVLSNG